MVSCKLALAVVMPFMIAGSGLSQDWDSASTAGVLDLSWTRSGSEYTFVLKSPAATPELQGVLAWTLEPFNLPAPSEVICPTGWRWNDSGHWKQFSLVSSSTKYDVGGPALEPGESLTFVYTISDDDDPVNHGGPPGGGPAFLSHIASVKGQADGKWVTYATENGSTWYDAPKSTSAAPVPEPHTYTTIFFGFLRLAV
ncbi:MAG: hypothetical protein M1133_09640 [Armatimonadetes bacterium]|nr:hypothetical protein [Armatimonadota bacterium]